MFRYSHNQKRKLAAITQTHTFRLVIFDQSHFELATSGQQDHRNIGLWEEVAAQWQTETRHAAHP